MADEVPESSGADGGFRYKNLSKSSKLLGITNKFILFYFIFNLFYY